jgi:hypothetical protein
VLRVSDLLVRVDIESEILAVQWLYEDSARVTGAFY